MKSQVAFHLSSSLTHIYSYIPYNHSLLMCDLDTFQRSIRYKSNSYSLKFENCLIALVRMLSALIHIPCECKWSWLVKSLCQNLGIVRIWKARNFLIVLVKYGSNIKSVFSLLFNLKLRMNTMKTDYFAST